MLTNLIENRGKEFSNLLKIGDYLARSLRENVELFFVDGNTVTYLIESGYVVTGNYKFKPQLSLTNIEVEDASILEDRKSFEDVATKKVSALLADLIENDYQKAENAFDQILGLYETKLSYDRIKERLREKTDRFGESTKIVSTGEFQRVLELKDQLVKFLKENKELVNIPEVRNGMKLATVISRSFDLPKVDINSLKESKEFSLKTKSNNTLYEHLCRQELVAKELLETKQNFDKMWIDNEHITSLASMIYESDDEAIRKQVATVVVNIPYFSLATKKQLTSLFSNSLSLSELKITDKDVNQFVKKVYEMKKPVREHIISVLNDKYGININTLTDIPTFSNLIKTENVILTSLGKLAPKNSVLKKSLLELASVLKIKNGAEAIDLADFLSEVFDEAEYTDSLNETSLMNYLDFNRVADDLGKIGQVLKMITPLITGQGAGAAMGGMPQPAGGVGMDQTPDLGQGPDLGSPDPMDSNAEAGLPGESGTPDPEAIAQEVAMEDADGMEDEMGPEMGMEPGMEDGMGMDTGLEDAEAVDHVDSDQLSDLISSVEDVLANLKSELGMPDMDMEGGEEEFDPDVDFADGGAEEGEDPEFEEGEGEESDFDGEDDDGESDDSEEDNFPPKSKKK